MQRSLPALAALAVFAASVSAAAPAKPNLIVIYTDDHGHADLGIQGVVTDIKTPNIDALARSGVLAKHGYSTAPQCVPFSGPIVDEEDAKAPSAKAKAGKRKKLP